MSFPCPRCGARPDIDCGHRIADDEWRPPQQLDKKDKRKRDWSGQGFNFGTRKRMASRNA